MTRFRSIISRVVALHIVAIGVTSILMPAALYWILAFYWATLIALVVEFTRADRAAPTTPKQ